MLLRSHAGSRFKELMYIQGFVGLFLVPPPLLVLW